MEAHPRPDSSGPRELDLREWETRRGVALSTDVAARLTALAPRLEVRPALTGGFDLTATSWIGNVAIDDLSITIHPKVPVSTVLFLIAYSIDPEDWHDLDFQFDQEDLLLEAMAPGFITLTRHALARGLRRDYRHREDALQAVKGRIRFDDQIRRRFGRFPPAEVTYDEFTEDVPENQLLLAAVERLGRLRPRSNAVRRKLRRLRARFRGVSWVDYSWQPLPEIMFTRLNEHYRPAVRLARLILRESSISQRRGERRSSSFLVDMNDVFEDFAVTALREVLGLSDRAFPQQARGRRLWLDEARKVQLKPDLSWWQSGTPVFVGDVKYKDVEEGSVASSDLYQVMAYLEATGLTSGLLVYPRRVSGTDLVVRKSAKRIRLIGWSLQASPDEILAQVKETADWINQSVERRAAHIPESVTAVA